MNVFISWSGEQGNAIALELKKWLRLLYPKMDAFVSSESIRKGKQWMSAISEKLSTTSFGIICLVPGHLEAPWLLFEAGAIAKLKESCVWTLMLGGVETTHLSDSPLSNYQATAFTKDDFKKLLNSINEVAGADALPPEILETHFDNYWGKLEQKITEILSKHPEKREKEKSTHGLLKEILDIVSTRAREESLAQRNRAAELETIRRSQEAHIKMLHEELEFQKRREEKMALDALMASGIPKSLIQTPHKKGNKK